MSQYVATCEQLGYKMITYNMLSCCKLLLNHLFLLTESAASESRKQTFKWKSAQIVKPHNRDEFTGTFKSAFCGHVETNNKIQHDSKLKWP